MFSIACIDDAGEIRLDVVNYPQLVLSLSRFPLPCSGVAHIAALSLVCVEVSSSWLLPMFTGSLSNPLELCTTILVALCCLSMFLFLYPPPRPFSSPILSGPSSPASVNRRRSPVCIGCLPWRAPVHETPFHSFRWDSLARSAKLLSYVVNPAIIGRSDGL